MKLFPSNLTESYNKLKNIYRNTNTESIQADKTGVGKSKFTVVCKEKDK